MATSRAQRALRFTHVRLENWRNFRRVDLELRSRAFLVGPNASGKSNLIDAFRFLHDLVSVGGGFVSAVTRPQRGGVSALRCLAARRYSDVTLDVTIGSDEEAELWRYELTFNQDKQRRPFIKRERVFHHGEELLDRPTAQDEADPDRLRQTFLEQVNVNRDFRQVVEFLSGVQYLHIVPQLIREPDRSVGRENDPYGGDLLEQIARVPSQTQAARLRRIREALQVAVPQLVDIELVRDERGTPHLQGRYQHWRQTAAKQSEHQFSDGTLRLVGLLWSVLAGTGPLLLEEPELSLHPAVVRHLAPMFARAQRNNGRQVIASTHSPDLLLDEGIGLDEVVLLRPDEEGTTALPAADVGDIEILLKEGETLADAVLPYTKPDRAEQLALALAR